MFQVHPIFRQSDIVFHGMFQEADRASDTGSGWGMVAPDDLQCCLLLVIICFLFLPHHFRVFYLFLMTSKS